MAVCLDASFIAKLLLPEDGSREARALWERWIRAGEACVGPPLLFAEVTSILRATVYRGRILPAEGETKFSQFRALSLQALEPPELQEQAWALARLYKQSRAYDAQYLAVALLLGCDLWTADHRLANSVNAPWVRVVG